MKYEMKRMRIFAFLTGLCLLASPARTQIVFVNLTSLATNQTSSSAFITISGVCTDAPYTATNPASIQIGDSLPTAFGEINSSFNYVSNELIILLQAPYQYNTNLVNLISILGTAATNNDLSLGASATNFTLTTITNVVNNASNVLSWLAYTIGGNVTNLALQVGGDGTNNLNSASNILSDLAYQIGTDTTNNLLGESNFLSAYTFQVGNDATNLIYQVGTDITNNVATLGGNVTNAINAIWNNTGSPPATSFIIYDSSGTAWYIHVSTLGVLTATGSP